MGFPSCVWGTFTVANVPLRFPGVDVTRIGITCPFVKFPTAVCTSRVPPRVAVPSTSIRSVLATLSTSASKKAPPAPNERSPLTLIVPKRESPPGATVPPLTVRFPEPVTALVRRSTSPPKVPPLTTTGVIKEPRGDPLTYKVPPLTVVIPV